MNTAAGLWECVETRRRPVSRLKGLCLRVPQSRVSIIGAGSCFCFLRAFGSGDAASVQQLMFGASAERRVASSSQNHPSDAERDGVRDEASTIWTVSASECRGSNGETCPWTTPRSQKETETKTRGLFSAGCREVSHIWRQNVWLACLAQRNGGSAGENASDWFGADRKWSCSVFNLFKSSPSSRYSRNVMSAPAHSWVCPTHQNG